MKPLLNLLVLSLVLLTSCLESSTSELEENSFVRIYDNADFNASFKPIDVQQTADGGYLLLSTKRLPDSNFAGVFLVKASKTGSLVNEVNDFDTQFVNPVGPLHFVNGAYFFVCMDANTQEAQLIRISADGSFDTATPLGLTYPVASAPDGNNLLLLSYNNVDKEMVIAQITADGVLAAGPTGFGIGVGDDTEEPIINHFLQGEKKFPFQIGRVPGGAIFYNGFYNYTFSLVFTNFGATNPAGVVYGQQDNGGFSAVKAFGGTSFATARFNFGDNYLLPKVELSTNDLTIGTDLEGFSLPELSQNTDVRLLELTTETSSAIIYAANTQSKQIALLFYDKATGAFLNSKYIGFSNPFEIGNLIQTSDGGLLVCGTTFVAGRFSRICLIKLAQEEIKSLLKQ